jgi:UDP-3-O-[3-hydroxymyristoyl] glucosamine N-acyltransferase
VKLHEIAILLGAELDGEGDREIRNVAKIEEASQGDLTFLANPKYSKHLASTQATAVIVSRLTARPEGRKSGDLALLKVSDPYASFVKTVAAFHPQPPPVQAGIHPTAVIDPTAILGVDVRVGPHAVIGAAVRIGDRSMIGPCAVVGERAELGTDCIIYSHVTVREGCRIGNRVILQPGAVIGGDGFGFAPQADGSFEKIPQIGIVVLEDDVEIQANTTVDRATLGETRVKRGVKLDNLIQVAHNVVIGENTVMAAQAGISGSTKLGKQCMVGGQVGFTGHIDIADGTKVGAQSGVHRSVAQPNTTIFGYPAMPQKEAFRIAAGVTHVPELLDTVRELQKQVDDLKLQLSDLKEKQS